MLFLVTTQHMNVKYLHKVVMTNTFGQLKYTTTKMIELSGNVRAMLENAVAGPFKSYTYPMDVGSTIYEGNLIISSGSYKNIRLGTKWVTIGA